MNKSIEFPPNDNLSSSDMLISIVVPIFNSGQFWDECILSVIEQSYHNWQLILIDDGSTDDSSKICISYAKSDQRIQYYYKENTGQFDSRRRGVKNSDGDYIMFFGFR